MASTFAAYIRKMRTYCKEPMREKTTQKARILDPPTGMEVVVAIVGAGPSGLATAACLNKLSVPNIILEREDCCASLWKNRTYERLKLHLAKSFCELPYMPFPPSAPTYISRNGFIKYIDNYVSQFNINPRYSRLVQSATYDVATKKWCIKAKNSVTNQMEVYISDFLVAATGENSEGLIPEIPGLESFKGKVIHSSQYKSGWEYTGKEALVVGSGNSGMEIAYDLCNSGASTSLVVRSPFHVLTKEMVHLGMILLKFIPLGLVDGFIVMLEKAVFGDLAKYGIRRPAEGPFHLKAVNGRSPVLDVGTVNKIKTGEIRVVPEISSIKENYVVFDNKRAGQFDLIIFATGYKSTTNYWLKDYSYVLNDSGMPKYNFPKHWKGENGLYCAGLSQRGLAGVSMDAKAIALDISAAQLVGKEKIY